MAGRWMMLVAVALLFGCASGNPGERGGIKLNAYFGKATMGQLPCPGPRCDLGVIPSCNAGGDCGGDLDYDPINVTGTNVRIIWTLPRGYVFCRQLGDGVFLKNEVSDQFRLEPYNGDDNCQNTFTVTAMNTRKRPLVPYQYMIVFRPANNLAKTYVIDPSMYNL